MENPTYIIAGLGLLIFGVMFVAPAIGITYKRFRHMGFAFALIAAGFLHSMATKPPTEVVIHWDDYLADNGTYLTTNNVGTITGICFKWRKTDAALPNTQPLYISKRQGEGEYSLVATTTVGMFEYTATIPNTTNYNYYVWHEWEPPSPVRTNGVWLGTVIEKAKGSGVDKLLIIQGELIENERKLNP